MQEFRFDDTLLRVRDAGDGEPIMLIHGALLAGLMDPFFDAPALAAHRLVAPRRRGFGGTGAPVTADPGVHAADSVRLLDALGIDAAHVVGHSAGGAVALQLAVDAPERVLSLALLEPLVPLVHLPESTAVQQIVQSLTILQGLAQTDAVRAVDLFLAAVAGPETAELVGSEALAGAVADAAATFEGDLGMMNTWSLPVAAITAIACPVLHVLGAETGEVHRDIRAALLRWLPKTVTADIDGASHGLQVEKPAAVAGAIAAFVDTALNRIC